MTYTILQHITHSSLVSQTIAYNTVHHCLTIYSTQLHLTQKFTKIITQNPSYDTCFVTSVCRSCHATYRQLIASEITLIRTHFTHTYVIVETNHRMQTNSSNENHRSRLRIFVYEFWLHVMSCSLIHGRAGRQVLFSLEPSILAQRSQDTRSGRFQDTSSHLEEIPGSL